MSSDTLPKLHNAMWPGLVGKGTDEGQEPPISLERMLELTAAAEVDGQKFDGIDYFLFLPHTDPNASDDELMKIADLIASHGFNVGSLVAPVWPGTVGDSAMGDDAARAKFLEAVKMACRIAGVFNKHGVRKYGAIRIDSAEFGVAKFLEDPDTNLKRIVGTFKEAAKIAADHGERLAAEGEVCWAGLHTAALPYSLVRTPPWQKQRPGEYMSENRGSCVVPHRFDPLAGLIEGGAIFGLVAWIP